MFCYCFKCDRVFQSHKSKGFQCGGCGNRDVLFDSDLTAFITSIRKRTVADMITNIEILSSSMSDELSKALTINSIIDFLQKT